MAERVAQNTPMQGSGADIIKLAMIKTVDRIARDNLRAVMLLTVHDELVFEVPEDEVAWARETIPRIMASVVQLKVPLLAEVGVGRNWDEAH